VDRFLLGINYWPRHSAMYAWEHFDAGAINEDMQRIRELGLEVVRFFLTWETFQPSADAMNPEALRRFDLLMQMIDDAGLRAMPTLFTGHMSGVNWLPAWTLDPNTPHGRFRTVSNGTTSPYGIGDFYADETLLRAQELFARKIGERVRDHPAMYVWDLGNEFSNLREPRTPQEAATWSARLTGALIESSGAQCTGGTHGEDLERDRHIRPSSIAKPWAFATMHGYPVYSAFARSRTDPDVCAFLAQIMQSCSGKSVLFSELGNPSCPPGTVSPYDRLPLPGEAPLDPQAIPKDAASFACLQEEEMANYAYAALDRLQTRGALGAFWWCWADYPIQMADRPPFDLAPHELRFGIVRADGQYKQIAETLSGFAKEDRKVVAAEPPLVTEDAYYASLPEGILIDYRAYCTAYV